MKEVSLYVKVKNENQIINIIPADYGRNLTTPGGVLHKFDCCYLKVVLYFSNHPPPGVYTADRWL